MGRIFGHERKHPCIEMSRHPPRARLLANAIISGVLDKDALS